MDLQFSDEEYRLHLIKHNILIVDDEDYKRYLAGGVALANGFFPQYAKTPEEAWNLLNTRKYDLLISDNYMPTKEKDPEFDYDTNTGLHKLKDFRGNQGLQLLRRIKSTETLKDLEVIIYTGSGEKEQTIELGGIYVGQNLPLLNEILRQRSNLLRNVKIPRTGYWKFLNQE